MSKEYNPLKLLPTYFKYIGIGIISVLIILYFICFSSWSDFKDDKIYRNIFEIILLLSLTMIATAKEHVEDERLLTLRIKIAGVVAVAVVSSMIGQRIVTLILVKENLDLNVSAFVLIVMMFFWYFLLFNMLKNK